MNDMNIVHVVFEKNELYKRTSSLWQYDYGQILMVTGLNLPKAVSIDFSLFDGKGESIRQVGVTQDGVTKVRIPDSLLKNKDVRNDYNIYVYVYVADGEKGNTLYKIIIPVKNRPEPHEMVIPDEKNMLDEAIKTVSEAAERAELSEKNAKQSEEKANESYLDTLELKNNVDDKSNYIDRKVEEFEKTSNEHLEKTNKWMNKSEAWAHGHVDYPENAEDNAKYYSDLAKQSAEQAGFVKFHINEAGRLILQRTQNIKDSLDFRLKLNTGRLEVIFK